MQMACRWALAAVPCSGILCATQGSAIRNRERCGRRMNHRSEECIMELRKTHTTILNQGDPEQKRAEILEYFHATYTIDERLYDTLKYDDTFYLRADRLRHPLIFYLGHTATFFVKIGREND